MATTTSSWQADDSHGRRVHCALTETFYEIKPTWLQFFICKVNAGFFLNQTIILIILLIRLASWCRSLRGAGGRSGYGKL